MGIWGKTWLELLGWQWTPRIQAGSGCRKVEGDLPTAASVPVTKAWGELQSHPCPPPAEQVYRFLFPVSAPCPLFSSLVSLIGRGSRCRKEQLLGHHCRPCPGLLPHAAAPCNLILERDRSSSGAPPMLGSSGDSSGIVWIPLPVFPASHGGPAAGSGMQVAGLDQGQQQQQKRGVNALLHPSPTQIHPCFRLSCTLS